jgi:hypothetical protein
MTDQLSETEDCSGAMVIDMKKLQGFLLEEQKDSIDEFGVFRQVVQLQVSLLVGGIT